jgi:phage protein D
MTLRPAYAITLGSATVSSEQLEPLAALVVERATDGGADGVVVTLGERPDLTVAEGDAVTVELGWDGETTLVFTGVVDAVERRIHGIEVTCSGGPALLAATRGDTTYLGQTAGQVVTALAGEAGVATGDVQDGVKLPVYVADSARSHHAHCLRLARWCGFGLYCDEAGALAFAPLAAATAPDRTFRYGADVLSASIQRAAPGAATTVVPESPASAQGDETSSWLVKDPSPNVGGSGTAILGVPALRTKDAATTAAQAIADRAARAAVSGRIEVGGAPDVALGSAVALEDMPDAELNATYEVRALRHVIDRRRGFRTQLVLGGTS